jgi:hypothetical protein
MQPSLYLTENRTPAKPTVQDKAFHKELEQMRADAEAGVIHTPKREPEDGGAPSLKLDDYPDL